VKGIPAAGVELSVSQRFKLYPLPLTTKNSTIRAIMTAIPIHIIMSVCSPPNFQSCKKFLCAIIALKTRLGNRCKNLVTAFRVVQEATGQIEPELEKPTKTKTFDAKAMGHLGGLRGGVARAARLTPERRVEIARKAALARWGSR